MADVVFEMQETRSSGTMVLTQVLVKCSGFKTRSIDHLQFHKRTIFLFLSFFFHFELCFKNTYLVGKLLRIDND